MKITSGSGKCQTIYHNGSYLLLYGTTYWQSFASIKFSTLQKFAKTTKILYSLN